MLNAPNQPIGQWRNQRGNKKYRETNESGKTIIQNLSDATKTVLKGKLIAIQSYIKK